MTVKATREGLLGDETSSGWHIDAVRMFCALPARKALFRWVAITNPANGQSCRAEVLDVGPWSEQDDAYVFGGARPLSESGRRKMLNKPVEAHHTNGAGIDLGEAVWHALGMLDNGEVDWVFAPLPGEPQAVLAA